MDPSEDEEALLEQLLGGVDDGTLTVTGAGGADAGSERITGEDAAHGAGSAQNGAHRPATSNACAPGSGQGQGAAMRLIVDVPPLLYPVWAGSVGASLTGAATEAVSGAFHSSAAIAASVADYLEQCAADGQEESRPRRTIPPGWTPTVRQVNLFSAAQARALAPSAGPARPAAPAPAGPGGGHASRRQGGMKTGRWTREETDIMLDILLCDFSEDEWPRGSDGRDVVRRRHFRFAARALGRRLQACMDHYRQLCSRGWTRGDSVPSARRSQASVKASDVLATLAMFPRRTASANEVLRAVEVQPHAMEGVDTEVPGRSLVNDSKLWEQRVRDTLARSSRTVSLGVRHGGSLVYRLEESYVPPRVPEGARHAAEGVIRNLAREGGLAARSTAVRDAEDRERQSAVVEETELDRILSDDSAEGEGS